MKQVYQADDGKLFSTKAECESYEANEQLSEEIQELFYHSKYSNIGDFVINNITELNKMISKTPTDWQTVPAHTLVEVRDDDEDWQDASFIAYEEDNIFKFRARLFGAINSGVFKYAKLK